MMSFSRCSSQKKLQDKAPMSIGDVYCQSWVGGIQGAGSGINIFIPAETLADKDVVMDSVYFRGKKVKLETKPQNSKLYIGRISTSFNKPKNIIMSSDGNAEYGNKLPEIPEKIPFDLKDNECVVSYKEGNKIKYFKIENVVEKMQQAFPSAPPNKQ